MGREDSRSVFDRLMNISLRGAAGEYADETRDARRPVPISNSYWVPGLALLAGEYPGALSEAAAAAKLDSLLNGGVTSFVDLTAPADGMLPYDGLLRAAARERGSHVTYRRMEIPDMDVTGLEEMRAILSHIDAEMHAGRTVYVHCWGGVGRTGTVVGCMLTERGVTGDDALAEVARLFATMSPAKLRRHPEGSPQTERQRAMVRHWQREASPTP